MLSKHKWTFSLASFVMVIAFGLVIYAPSVMADGATHDFGVAISPAENMIDVSSDGGMQIASGRDRDVNTTPKAVNDSANGRILVTGATVSLLITTNEIVHLARPGASLTERDGPLDISDLVIDAYGPKGRALGIIKLVDDKGVPILVDGDGEMNYWRNRNSYSHHCTPRPAQPGQRVPCRDKRERATECLCRIRQSRCGLRFLRFTRCSFLSPRVHLNQADIAHVTAIRNDAHVQHTSAAVAVYRVDLVDDDEGLGCVQPRCRF